MVRNQQRLCYIIALKVSVTDLEFPLSGHNFSVGSENHKPRKHAGFGVIFNEVAQYPVFVVETVFAFP